MLGSKIPKILSFEGLYENVQKSLDIPLKEAKLLRKVYGIRLYVGHAYFKTNFAFISHIHFT